MKEKVVCFAGHRHDWQNVGIESKLRDIIIDRERLHDFLQWRQRVF